MAVGAQRAAGCTVAITRPSGRASDASTILVQSKGARRHSGRPRTTMCARFDQIVCGIHPNIARSTGKINKLKNEVIWAIFAFLTVTLLFGPFTRIDNAQIHALDYTSISTASKILKAYVRFTGTQFLIINKNQFDWTNVRIEINADISQDHPLHETVAPSAFMLMVSGINTGEAYSVGVTQFRREDGVKLDPVTTKPENIRIWSDTPHGRGFWYGGFVQPPAAADWSRPTAERRFQP